MEINFVNLTKSYQGKTILENVSGKIAVRDKIGLVGANGIGKTTLARLLSGREGYDSGEIVFLPRTLKTYYVEQYPSFSPTVSVYEELLEAALNNPRIIKKDAEGLSKEMLSKVGLGKEKWKQRAASLSGGEKTKLSLCKAMVSHFDFLILDEPTNHLDLKSYEWLEEYVQSLDKPVLIISHDRFFLDKTVNKIWELTSRGLKKYDGNYTHYRVQKERELKNQLKEYEKQEAKIQDLKEAMGRLKGWYNQAHKEAGQNDFYRSKAKKHAKVLKAKERQLERIEKNKLEKPEKTVSPAFEVINKSIIGQKFPPFLIQGRNLSKSFGEKTVFADLSFDIKRKDKVALIGPNGVGKSTLLKIICGIDKDFRGRVIINPSVKLGYFAQELDNLRPEKTILDNCLMEDTNVNEARLLLASLLFRGDDVYKKVADLSMGEKGRVAFARLVLSGANFLVLDELTNYMDIQSQEKIEAVLEEFEGSILFVSHDRYFIKRLAGKIFVLENQKLTCYDGDYEFYLKKIKEQSTKAMIGSDYALINDNIQRLEVELAFLSGKLNESLEEEEKAVLNEKFLATARELNRYKKLLAQLKE